LKPARREPPPAFCRSADAMLPGRPVRARYGKGERAEPVSILFARGKARFVGAFPRHRGRADRRDGPPAKNGRAARPTAPTRWSGRSPSRCRG